MKRKYQSLGMYKNRLIVITGCDSGIGKSLAELFLRRGYSVVASYLEPSSFKKRPNLYRKKMDLRVPSEIDEFCHFVKDLCKRGLSLEAVVCNAGIAMGGPIENIPLSMYREIFEINYFGVVKILQSLMPEIQFHKSRIVVNGSFAGTIALPFLSPYVSTKYALEGFCDSLRREMRPYGVKTILLEPAAVATPIWNKAKKQDISFVDEKYMKSLQYFQDNFIEGGNNGLEVKVAAVQIAKIMSKKHPKARYLISKNVVYSKLLQCIPTVLLDGIIARLFHMDYGNKKKHLKP